MNTYGDISPRTAAYAAKRLLERGQALLIVERFGQIDAQGQNKTLTRKFRRYNALAAASSPLAEGVTPKGSKITYTDVECTLEQYGDWVLITDVIQDTHEDPVLMEMMDVCGEQAAETIEIVRIAVLKAGTSVFYAGGVSLRTDLAATCSRNMFHKIKRFFANNRARAISKIIRASVNYGTDAVAAAYFVMAHTDLEYDISQMNGFSPIEKYADSTKALPGEVGKVDSFRFILSDLFTPWEDAGAAYDGSFLSTADSKNDVYPMICVGENAYGIVPLQGKNAVTPMAKNPTPTESDPMAQRGFVSWKTYQTAVILNDLWMCRYEVCATKL
uniref:Putative capsid protein n=1 Tax=viral metagenome TaxID=1070528 RepID=A0A6M3KVD3_9ZZZZ